MLIHDVSWKIACKITIFFGNMQADEEKFEL